MTQPPPREPAPHASLTARYLTPARTLLRALLAVVGAGVAAMALVAMLVAVQGRSADTRHADAIVVVGTACGGAASGECPAPATLDHALDLFRRGYAPRVLVAADNVEAAHAHLLASGLPAAALLEVGGGASPWQRTDAAVGTLHAEGMASALLVGQPSDMLLALKMTRDLGLTVYAAPITGAERIPPLGTLLAEAGAYWRYVLLGE